MRGREYVSSSVSCTGEPINHDEIENELNVCLGTAKSLDVAAKQSDPYPFFHFLFSTHSSDLVELVAVFSL